MRVIGVDPGSRYTGYGIVSLNKGKLIYEGHGTIKLSARASFSERLGKVFSVLMELIGQFKPDGMAVEDVFFARNVQSALKLGQVRGVAILSAVINDVPVFEYTPLQVKQAIVGYGRASKDQVFRMLVNLLKLQENIDSHASDALAVAVCHLHTGNHKIYKLSGKA